MGPSQERLLVCGDTMPVEGRRRPAALFCYLGFAEASAARWILATLGAEPKPPVKPMVEPKVL